MTKYDYLASLKHHLHALPEKERNAAIRHYDKYFTDAGPENEQSVISSLGSPRNLADKIVSKDKDSISSVLNETKENIKNVYKKMNESQKKQARLLMLILFPVWIVIALIFIFLLGLFAAFIFGTLLFLAIAGIVLFSMSFPYIFNLTSVGLLLLGISLICMGIPVLTFMPASDFVVFVIKKSSAKFIRMFNYLIIRKARDKK